MNSYGYNNADSSPRVDPLSTILAAAAAVVVSEPKSFFKLAENCKASSLWVGRHRYVRILCVSKPLWENNAHKVEPNTGPIINLSKSSVFFPREKQSNP